MKKKNLLQTCILIITFCMMNQFVDGQVLSCKGKGQVLMCRGGCGFFCSKCVSKPKVQDYINSGWAVCSPLSLKSSAENPDEDAISIFPNPVSNSSTILFSLAQAGKASMKIFDLNGRLVKTLADGEMTEGEHQIEWNAADVNAGVYFLQIQSAEFSQMAKIIVTK